MAKKKATDESLKEVEKEDAKKKDFQVREDKKDSSIRSDEEKPNEGTYPYPDEEDKQYKNQPEFTEPKSNKSKEA